MKKGEKKVAKIFGGNGRSAYLCTRKSETGATLRAERDSRRASTGGNFGKLEKSFSKKVSEKFGGLK